MGLLSLADGWAEVLRQKCRFAAGPAKLPVVGAEAMRINRGCIKRSPISGEKPEIQVSSVGKVACRFGYLLQKCES
jgi:hypothetical protein